MRSDRVTCGGTWRVELWSLGFRSPCLRQRGNHLLNFFFFLGIYFLYLGWLWIRVGIFRSYIWYICKKAPPDNSELMASFSQNQPHCIERGIERETKTKNDVNRTDLNVKLLICPLHVVLVHVFFFFLDKHWDTISLVGLLWYF